MEWSNIPIRHCIIKLRPLEATKVLEIALVIKALGDRVVFYNSSI